MSDINRKPKSHRNQAAVPSVNDVTAPSAQFPNVGMTLSSYQRNTPINNNHLPPVSKRLPRWRRLLKKVTLKRTFITLLLIFLIGGGYFGGKFIYDLHKAFGGSIFDLFHTSKLKGEATGRVNILLAGQAGQNSGQTGGPELTDSIILLSIDTKNNTAWMLSIPRDLWVKVPNHGYQKINAVYEYGQADNFSAAGYPSGGMGELEQLVSQSLSLPIDYYALINYQAFKQAVDAVGGITINIQSSDPRGLYDAYTNLKLANGPVNLNGQQALNLARARGDTAAGDISYGFLQSDFDRQAHQRQMLEALKTKATSAGVLSNPLKLSQLFDALGNNVTTDLNLSNARRLYDLSKVIPNTKIQSLSLNNANGKNLLASYTSYDGQAALIPAAGFNNYSAIQSFISQHSQP